MTKEKERFKIIVISIAGTKTKPEYTIWQKEDCLHQKSIQHLTLQEPKQLIKQKPLTEQMKRPFSEKPSKTKSSIRATSDNSTCRQAQQQAPPNNTKPS